MFRAAVVRESMILITVSVLRNCWSMVVAVSSSESHYTNIFGCLTPLSFCFTGRITSPSFQPRGRILNLILIRLTSSSAILTKFIGTFLKKNYVDITSIVDFLFFYFVPMKPKALKSSTGTVH